MRRHLTPRGRALRWMTLHRGCTEQPNGANRDKRKDGITAAQRRLGGWLVGAPWCGVWVASALKAAGVLHITERFASVAAIEVDARKKLKPFRGWTTDPSKALRGDLVVLFGKGIHVGMIREVDLKRRVLITDEGNTSSGNVGSQDNGGGSYRRVRPFSAIHGIALVDFPDH